MLAFVTLKKNLLFACKKNILPHYLHNCFVHLMKWSVIPENLNKCLSS